jgi:hypothetical protein
MTYTELRAAVLGPVLVDGDPEYDEVRVPWNGMYYDRRPGVIVRCMGVADIQAAIAFARANGLPIAVRGGGHSVSGSSTIDESGMLIDTRLMHGVRVDPERRVAVAAAGTLWSEFDRECQVHGLATTGGMISHTGISGLTLNGGVGRFMRKRGLTCDNVVGLDVVLADGRWVHADAETNPDLFWALRGGGGDFGIVTHFEFALHPLGPIVYGGYLGWRLDQTKEVFEALHDEIVNAPDELQLEFIWTTAPAMELIPPDLQGAVLCLLTITWMDNDLEAGERAIAPFREKVAPSVELVQPFPYAFLQCAVDALAPYGRNTYSYAGYFAEAPDELIDMVVEFAGSMPAPECVIELYQMGGQVMRVPKDATPASAFRDGEWYYIAGGSWWHPQEGDAVVDWVKRLDSGFGKFRLPGRYISFVSDDDAEGQKESLGDDTWARLAAIKAKVDPDNVFARNPNKRAAAVPA